MKLKDIYENMQLKKNDDYLKSSSKPYHVYDYENYQILWFPATHRRKHLSTLTINNILIKMSTNKSNYELFNYHPNTVSGHNNIAKFIETNLDEIVYIEKQILNNKQPNIESRIKQTFIDIPNYDGYSDWKLIDSNFHVDVEHFSNWCRDNYTSINKINMIYYKPNIGYYFDKTTFYARAKPVHETDVEYYTPYAYYRLTSSPT